MARPLNHPTLAQLRMALQNQDDPFAVIIRGHQGIEALLLHALCEVLTANHVSLKRVTFLAKVDLAIALKLLRPTSRNLASYINAVRNRFAHEFGAKFTIKDTGQLLESFGPHQHHLSASSDLRSMTPSQLLAHACASLYIEIDHLLIDFHKTRVVNEVITDMVLEALGDGPHTSGMPKHTEFVRQLADRLKAKGVLVDKPPSPGL